MDKHLSDARHAQEAAVVGVVSDGKAGHLNQSLGLAEALVRLRPGLSVREIVAGTPGRALTGLVGRRLSVPPGLKLLLGAGHRTHLSLLALRRSAACPAVVLMGPSLPVGLFDLCIQPRHDGADESRRLWLSEGPLNRMQPVSSKSDTGLILVGGPSPHNEWNAQELLQQIRRVCDGSRRWELTGSRRTPPAFLQALREQNLPSLRLYEPDELPPGWLSQRLPQAPCCWVTPDSASMVYEALTAGCAVGLFDLATVSGSRVAGAVLDLAERGLLTPFGRFAQGCALAPPSQRFAEADRCAQRIAALGWV